MKGERREFKVRTFESYWVSKNVLPFAKSPKFDYKRTFRWKAQFDEKSQDEASDDNHCEFFNHHY